MPELCRAGVRVEDVEADEALVSDQAFPSADEIAARAREAAARPSQWQVENVRLAQEFAEKMAAAGLEPPKAPSIRWPSFFDGRGWATPSEDVLLAPGTPPFWWKSTWSPGYGLELGTRDAESVDLEALPELTRWNPAEFRDCLMRQIPR
jgi:hypothetical protein